MLLDFSMNSKGAKSFMQSFDYYLLILCELIQVG